MSLPISACVAADQRKSFLLCAIDRENGSRESNVVTLLHEKFAPLIFAHGIFESF
jgi:hypothetical protein